MGKIFSDKWRLKYKKKQKWIEINKHEQTKKKTIQLYAGPVRKTIDEITPEERDMAKK